jgi:hypothetical protein
VQEKDYTCIECGHTPTLYHIKMDELQEDFSHIVNAQGKYPLRVRDHAFHYLKRYPEFLQYVLDLVAVRVVREVHRHLIPRMLLELESFEQTRFGELIYNPLRFVPLPNMQFPENLIDAKLTTLENTFFQYVQTREVHTLRDVRVLNLKLGNVGGAAICDRSDFGYIDSRYKPSNSTERLLASIEKRIIPAVLKEVSDSIFGRIKKLEQNLEYRMIIWSQGYRGEQWLEKSMNLNDTELKEGKLA